VGCDDGRYDVLTYVVVLSLGGRTQLSKLKEDGMNVSLWLSSLAALCGHLAKSYTGIQITALMQLLVNKLKDSQSIDLLVLKEVIGRMTGVDVLQDMSDDQVRLCVFACLECLPPCGTQSSPDKARTPSMYPLRDPTRTLTSTEG
jgi:hypothetical protein